MQQPVNDGDAPWWRRAVLYQIYVRSFADSTGDGTGDINGLRARLPYLRQLGVDGLWLNPWYRSPLADGGYDVADYRQIEPRYGTLADAEAFIAEAHDHGVRVIVDIVPNHTSIEHAWFQEALTAEPGSTTRARYHFRPGRGPGGAEPPTNWTSVFGGPAWSRVADGDWYLHLFDPTQPDLNWDHPDVRAEFEAVLRFWLDRGADGFRVDVAHGLVKDPSWPDLEHDTSDILSSAKTPNHPFWDRDGIHDIVPAWRAILDDYSEPGNERMMVAEAWVQPHRLPLYVRSDEYHQSFNFDLLSSDWDPVSFRQIIDHGVEAAAEVGSTSTWVLSNHDVVRHATRYGLPPGTKWRRWLLDGPHDVLDADLGLRRARAAALLVLALPGSTYLYQGEELGLPEVWDLPPDVLDDPVWERSSHTRKGRDGCRVPLPWSADGPSLGFGDGPPWLPQPEAWRQLAALVQADDADSTLELYRRAIAMRRHHFAADETMRWLDTPGEVLAFERASGAQCWVNFGARPVTLPNDRTVLVRSSGSGPQLGQDEAAWLA